MLTNHFEVQAEIEHFFNLGRRICSILVIACSRERIARQEGVEEGFQKGMIIAREGKEYQGIELRIH